MSKEVASRPILSRADFDDSSDDEIPLAVSTPLPLPTKAILVKPHKSRKPSAPKANSKASQQVNAKINNGDDGPESGSANESKLSDEEFSLYAPSEDDDDLRVTAERGDYAVKEKLQREVREPPAMK